MRDATHLSPAEEGKRFLGLLVTRNGRLRPRVARSSLAGEAARAINDWFLALKRWEQRSYAAEQRQCSVSDRARAEIAQALAELREAAARIGRVSASSEEAAMVGRRLMAARSTSSASQGLHWAMAMQRVHERRQARRLPPVPGARRQLPHPRPPGRLIASQPDLATAPPLSAAPREWVRADTAAA